MFTFGHIGTFSQHWLNVRSDEKGPSPEELSCEAPSQCWDTTRNFSRHPAEPLYVFPPALSVAGTLQNIASTGSCCTNTWETWGILNATYHYIPIHAHTHTHIYIYTYIYIYIRIYIYIYIYTYVIQTQKPKHSQLPRFQISLVIFAPGKDFWCLQRVGLDSCDARVVSECGWKLTLWIVDVLSRSLVISRLSHRLSENPFWCDISHAIWDPASLQWTWSPHETQHGDMALNFLASYAKRIKHWDETTIHSIGNNRV